MNFRPELAAKVMAGRKTVTRRLTSDNPNSPWWLVDCSLRVGRDYAVCPGRGKQAIGRVVIVKTELVTLGRLPNHEAIREGFSSTGEGRGVDEPLPTQGGSETMGLLSARVMPNRTNGTSQGVGEPMATVVGGAGSGGLGILSTGLVPYRTNNAPTSSAEPLQTVSSQNVPGVLTAAGRIQCNGSIEEAKYRTYPVDRPLGTVVGSAVTQGLLFSGWYKQNGSTGNETAPHPVTDPLGTLTGRDTTALLAAEWREALADLKLEDCYFRMMGSHEIGRGCGFDVDFADHKGTFLVWGSARDQVDGFGNAVSPQVGEWISERLRRVLHGVAA